MLLIKECHYASDYIGIVNSDDVYEKNALEIIYKYLEKDKHKKLDFILEVSGNVRSPSWI